MKATLRLARTDLARALGTYRWLVAVPTWFAAVYLSLDYVRYDYDVGGLRPVNLWDAVPGLFTNANVVLFVFVLGFVFLTGDLYVRDRTLGVASMTVLRAPSRGHWWSAKICALGVLSVVYSSLVLVVMLLLGGIQLGWSTTASPTALRGEFYSRWAELPIPVFVLVIMLYVTLPLWAIGAVVMLVSTIVPHPLTPAMAGLVWVLMGEYSPQWASAPAGHVWTPSTRYSTPPTSARITSRCPGRARSR